MTGGLQHYDGKPIGGGLQIQKIAFGSGTGDIPANSTRWLSILDNERVETDADRGRVYFRRTGTIQNFKMWTEFAPGVGESWVFTFQLNGVDQTLAVTIAGAVDTSAEMIINPITIAVDDYITFKIVSSATAIATSMCWGTVEWVPD